MTRLRISRPRPFFKYFLYIIILFCLFLIITHTLSGFSRDASSILTAGIIGVLALLAVYSECYTSTIEFDDENMYLISKQTAEEIPLKQVTAIKLTSNRVNNSHYWDIYYNDGLNNNRIVQVLPKVKNFALFKEKVKEKNPEAEIKESIFF